MVDSLWDTCAPKAYKILVIALFTKLIVALCRSYEGAGRNVEIGHKLFEGIVTCTL